MKSFDYLSVNKARWNELVGIHSKSDAYRLKEFLRGHSTLRPIELSELGDVQGKRMLHLQCHFGLDSLSWARAGVKVVGVDFSEKAIELARKLNDEVGLDAEFICCDILSLPEVLTDEFDIVFTSYGVLCWIEDLKEWAKVIACFLKPGGIFYIVEEHPIANVFEVGEDGSLEGRYNYFSDGGPIRCENDRTYTGDDQVVQNAVSYQWDHTLADIFDAILSAGLRVEHFHEFPYCMYDKYPGLMEKHNDYWWLKQDHQIPLLFSLRAIKSS
ncbi:class I SAM-dependent methyltransferase [Alicyclobacillus macrosporangiidus]|uniref:Methyltransferase domain-containing protein n=1 Tax=Alicyclobacillus macrosporangiidus TaxID=392015 RepID=A0A1I7HGZ2_9BACL|nr:class I SAM-dependent methyltransferase [Alicyclobacillus macrosporangiidus]SFU59809.1 Methyltransferase domain-containing protein [Alicyclobacillus macrosporangiidus]